MASLVTSAKSALRIFRIRACSTRFPTFGHSSRTSRKDTIRTPSFDTTLPRHSIISSAGSFSKRSKSVVLSLAAYHILLRAYIHSPCRVSYSSGLTFLWGGGFALAIHASDLGVVARDLDTAAAFLAVEILFRLPVLLTANVNKQHWTSKHSSKAAYSCRSPCSIIFCSCTWPFISTHTDSIITKEECILLNEILGTKTPAGCYNFSRTDFEDKFTVPGSDKTFEGRDEEKHRK